MVRTYFIPHDSIVILLPTPSRIRSYLDRSEIWEPYEHPNNPDITGYVCRKYGPGKDVHVFHYRLERSEDNYTIYDALLLSAIGIMAGVEDVDNQTMIGKINEGAEIQTTLTIEG